MLYEDELLTIDHISGHNVVRLTWLDGTEGMDDEGFKASLVHYADAIEQVGAAGLLIDVRGFKSKMNPDLNPWRQKEIMPRYQGAGVRRIAFLHSGDYPLPEATEQTDFSISNHHFDNPAHALAWAATGFAVHITVQYRVRDDVDLDELKQGIADFLGQVRAHAPGVHYVSGQDLADERSFRHIVRCVDVAALKNMQGADWFPPFGAFLKPKCAEGPSVTRYAVVATGQ